MMTIVSHFQYHSPVAHEPTLQDLMPFITKVGNYPVARGGFGEIWKCIYETDRGPINVCLWCIFRP